MADVAQTHQPRRAAQETESKPDPRRGQLHDLHMPGRENGARAETVLQRLTSLAPTLSAKELATALTSSLLGAHTQLSAVSLDARDEWIPFLAHTHEQVRDELFERLNHPALHPSPLRLAALRALIAASNSPSELIHRVAILPHLDRYSDSVYPLTVKAAACELAKRAASCGLDEPLTPSRASEARRVLSEVFLHGGSVLAHGRHAPSNEATLLLGTYLFRVLNVAARLDNPLPPRWYEEESFALFHIASESLATYGIFFADRRDTKSPGRGRWSTDELLQMNEVLDRFPRWALLGTPLLGVVVRSQADGHGSQGIRIKNGVIEMYNDAFTHSVHGEYLEGWSNAQVILGHELGHGLHFGRRYTLSLAPDGSILESGHPAIRFHDFAALSEWRAVRKHPKVVHQQSYVVLGRSEVPLHVPLQVSSGRHIELSYDPYAPSLTPIWMHNPDAGFTLGRNAHRSPWEDYADSAATYFLVPQVLRDLAPQKFTYFEGLFRCAEKNSVLPDGTRPKHRRDASLDPEALRKVLGL